MKKILFASISVMFAISATAQSGKVISAYNNIQSYENKEGASYLEEAVKNIDVAITDEVTGKATKTWWYRAKAYSYIASEETLRSKYPKAALEALKSFQKMQETNDPKFKDWSDATEALKALTANLFNDGITAFNAKNFADGYSFFYGVSEANDILLLHKSEVVPNTLSGALRNAGLCAENAKNNDQAFSAYNKYLVMAPDSMKAGIYISLINLSKIKKDTAGARRILDEALVKYPNNSSLIVSKINFFVQDGKQAEALDYLKKLLALDPNNKEVIYNLAASYEAAGDTANARKEYDHVLSIDPDHFQANLGYGALLYNMGNKINNQMNALGASPADLKKNDVLKVQRDALYMQARPYLQRAQASKPDNSQVKMALNNITAITGK